MFHLLQHELFAHQTAEEQSKMNRAMSKENSFHLSVFTFPSAAHADEVSLCSSCIKY